MFLGGQWIYDDPELATFARRLWWSQVFKMEAFEMIEVGEESSVGYVGKISTTLLSSPSNFSRQGEIRGALISLLAMNKKMDGISLLIFIWMIQTTIPIHQNVQY